MANKTVTVNKTWKTKDPTGFTVTRDGNWMKSSWKIGDADYEAANLIRYIIYYGDANTGKHNKHTYPDNQYYNEQVKEWDAKQKKYVTKTKSVKCLFWKAAPSTNTLNIHIDPKKYYPYTNKLLNSFRVEVAARRKPFETKSSKKSGNDTITTVTKYATTWNGKFVGKTYDVTVPAKPSISESLVDGFDNKSIFSWSSASHGQSNWAAWFTDYEWQSMIVFDSNVTDGSKLSWKKRTGTANNFWQTGTGTKKSISITEEYIGDNRVRTRWVRVRARGPQGLSPWAYAKHVYALPNRAAGVKPLGTELQGKQGYQIKVSWSSDWSSTSQKGLRPIDNTTVEYAIGIPNSSTSTSGGTVRTTLSLMDNPSWETAGSAISDTVGKDSLIFYIDRLLNEDECVWVRVNNTHDNRTTPGLPTFVQEGAFKTEYAKKNYLTGSLAKPSLTNVDYNPETHRAIITVDNSANQIPGTFVAVYYKTNAKNSKQRLVGVIPAGETSATIQLPNPGTAGIAIGLKSYIADYSPSVPATIGVTSYSISNKKMESPGIVWDGSAVPLPPSKVTLSSPTSGTIRVTWNWSWTAADGAELSWADNEDAWESTKEPTTYQINNTHVGAWNISGLEIGTWYVRVRLYKMEDDSITYGSYSDTKVIKLASAPLTPLLTLSDSVIPRTGQVTCYWVYTSTDGTAQMSAEICEATLNPSTGAYSYGKVIARATSAKKLTISAKAQKWKNGETHYLAARVSSVSGEKSEGWSEPVPIVIADLPTITVESTSLVDKLEDLGTPTYFPTTDTEVVEEKEYYIQSGAGTEEDPYVYTLVVNPEGNPQELEYYNKDISTRTYKALTTMPLLATVSGAGTDGSSTLIIERADDYKMDRPDGNVYDGYKGETISVITQQGDTTFSVDQSELLGLLDDGANYNLILSIKDTYGQTDSVTMPFTVEWKHQAIMPLAEIQSNQDKHYTLITPLAPVSYILTEDTSVVDKDYFTRSGSGTEEDPYEYTLVDNPSGNPKTLGYYEIESLVGDTCDIYRLSADIPELIIQGAEFGRQYIDPYPTLGSMGGHRVVFVTINGDYITADSKPAWVDYDEDDDNVIDKFATIINFGGNQVILPYDISLSSKWSKDFVETKYLGGSIQGDWNPAVSRSGSVKTNVVVFEDPDTIKLMRRLAVYPGICHVRTPDGSSFAANVDISEDRENKFVNKKASFSIDITRVDAERLDGMLYSEWIEEQGE